MLFRGMLGLGLLIALACATAAADPPARPLKETKMNGPTEAFKRACKEACEHSMQARAVAWQVVQAECAARCDEEWARPVVATLAALDKAADQPVRASGTLEQKEKSYLLRIEGGLASLGGPGLDMQLGPLVGKKVWVTGTAKKGALDNVTTVAAAD